MPKAARPESDTALQPAIGERFQWAREVRDVGQREAARALGISPSVLNKIEKGERPPSIFHVIRFSALYGAGPSYLLMARLETDTDFELAGKLSDLHPELGPPPRKPDTGPNAPSRYRVTGGYRPPRTRPTA